jgi:anhydro-N-acetylmuramic acid kinase
MNKHKVLGLMSGTSLDGLDIAFCEFIEGSSWGYKIIVAETIEYSADLKNLLLSAESASAIEYFYKEVEYSNYTANCCNIFLKKYGLIPDIISAHGHTIFHEPQKGITRQMLDGSILAAKTGIATICDFRKNDVALGGQGAPLVPIGDDLLMNEFDYCLNLGGIANISYNQNGKRLAFDICPANMALNYITSKIGLAFDNNGELARKGSVDKNLLSKLNQLGFYNEKPPKSLGKEWFVANFKSLIENDNLSTNDFLSTIVEHIAKQIANVSIGNKTMLVTGGGAFNKFLIERIKENTCTALILPDKMIINYKEALIFAFLGLLKYKGRVNSLATVTGAKKDCSGGVVYNS